MRVALLLLLALPACADLRAGFAKADITPEKPVPLAGYGARRGKLSTGVHDKVWARAAVFESAAGKAAVLSVDMVGVTAEVRERLVKGVCAELGITSESFLFCATHNHSGPGGLSKNVLIRIAAGNYDQELYDWMLTRLERAIRDADAALAPARIAAGRATFEGLSRNRAVDGGPTDPEGLVVKVIDPAGKLRGLFVSFSAHPTILGADNFEISADWPGAMARTLEQKYEGCVPFLLNGAEGDQSPRAPGGTTDWEKVDAMGRAVADAAAKAAEPLAAQDGTVSGKLSREALPPTAFGGTDWPKETWLQVFRLGPATLLCFPGEPCHEVGEAARGVVKGELVEVVACANDHLGYFVPESYYYAGGYESTLSFFGPRVQDWFRERFATLDGGVPRAPLAVECTREERGRVTLVTLRGDAGARGRTHGNSLRDEILAHSKFWREQIAGIASAMPVRTLLPFPDDVDPAPLLYPLLAIRCRMLLRECEPELLDEMLGVADGAGVSFDEIVFLNTWQAVADQPDPTALFRLKPGCATCVSGNWLAHNADWPPQKNFPDVSALFVVKPAKGRPLAYAGFAGCVSGPSMMNADALAAAVDSLPAPDDTGLEGVPVLLSLRTALQYNQLAADAAEALELSPGTAGYLVTLRDPAETIRLELSAQHASREPSRKPPKKDAKRRALVLEFEKASPKAKASAIRKLMGDREQDVLAPSTRHSVLMSVKSLRWSLAIGPGSEIAPDRYEEFDLKSLLK